MNKIQIIGRVFPIELRTTIQSIAFDYGSPQDGTATLSILDSAVNFTIEYAQDELEIFNEAIILAHEYVYGILDIISFSQGTCLTLVFEKCIIGDQHHTLAADNPARAMQFFGNMKPAVMDLVMQNFTLRFALRDLIMGATSVKYAAIGAARAIETIRHALKPSEGSRSWTEMHEALKVRELYLKGITEAAKDPRHGNRQTNAATKERQALERAWVVIDRYIRFLERGGHSPLPVGEFPWLDAQA